MARSARPPSSSALIHTVSTVMAIKKLRRVVSAASSSRSAQKTGAFPVHKHMHTHTHTNFLVFLDCSERQIKEVGHR